MTITEICSKAWADGWTFEYAETGFIIAKRGHESRIALTVHDANLFDKYQLGQAIAAAMNGEEG